MTSHIKIQNNSNLSGSEFAIAAINSDSPLLPVDSLEKLHQFRPDLVDFVITETKLEAELRRKEIQKINRYTFIERIAGIASSLFVSILGLGGAIWLGFEGHDWLAGVIGSVTIGTLAVAFLKSRH